MTNYPWRKRCSRSAWALCALLLATAAAAQQPAWSSLRSRWLYTAADSCLIDSLSLAPGSLHLRLPGGALLDTAYYRQRDNRLYWRSPAPADSVLAVYRVLPFNLYDEAFVVDASRALRTPDGILVSSYDPYASDGRLTGQRGLDYQGAFSRGISFGNRQDLVLNSSFNLQMNGELGDGIRVAAAITDENLPIQAEGNTQQLREFDRIFIQLERNRTQLIAGDYELRQPNGYFMQYFKKLEGATLRTPIRHGGEGELQTQASVAIARGQFTRRQLTPIEGNQGPYKLAGANGERYVIVLSGTERVFLDGRLLERGRDRDYIIDYNQGELTFMPRRLITKDSRITVEYEYADQRYLRSLYAINTEYRYGGWRLYGNLYSQQDSKTATGDLRLTPAQRAFLRDAGDDAAGLLSPGVDTLQGLASQRATYAWIDTTLNCGGRDTVVRYLSYTADPELGRYVATFTFVGEGQGHYQPDPNQAANERVYRWTPPDPATCLPTGSYEPVLRLAAPTQQRLFTAGAEYEGRGGRLRVEAALSDQDLNRFSTLGEADDQGYAARFDYSLARALGPDSTGWKANLNVGYEWVHRHFQPVNPYRSPEFLRDWNLASVLGIGATAPAEEHLAAAELSLQHPGWGRYAYRASTFQRLGDYSGWRHQADARLDRNGWRAAAQTGWAAAREATRSTRFWRPSASLGRNWKKAGGWQTDFAFEAERSERQPLAADTLERSSFYYRRYVATLASPVANGRQLSASWRRRLDLLPRGDNFTAGPRATEGELNGQWAFSPDLQLGGVFTYRRLEVPDTLAAAQQPGETFLGRLDLNWQAWKGAVRTNTTYEIGAGQEPRVELIYLFVGAGQGQYIWLDSLYNNDGKIQPNEMELSPFPDLADHVRITLFTDDFIRTDNVSLNQSLQLDPERLWRQAKGWRKQLARFSLQSSLTVNRKTQSSPAVQAWNPLQWSLPDSALTSINASLRHALFFNRRHPRFDVQLEQTDQRRRLVQTTGFESQRRTEYTLRLRYNLNQTLSSRAAIGWGERAADSEFFDNKDYQLGFLKLGPELTYQPGADFRVGGRYTWQQERNGLATAEYMGRHELNAEAAYQRWLRASLSWVQIDLEGDPRSPVGFALLNGLQPGANWLWNLTATRQLGRYLQLTLSYDGRRTGSARPVHVGRAQVTALF